MRYGFKLHFHADDDAKGFRSSISRAAKREQNRHGHPAQPQDALLNLLILREKIMKMVSLSSTQQVALDCVCFRFLLVNASDSACGQNP